MLGLLGAKVYFNYSYKVAIWLCNKKINSTWPSSFPHHASIQHSEIHAKISS